MRRFLTLTLALVSFLGFATAAPAHHGVALARHCHVHAHAHAHVAPTLTLATPFQQSVSYNTAAYVAQPTVALAATYSQPTLAATYSAPAPCPMPVPVPVPTPSPFQLQAPASCYGGTAGAGYTMAPALAPAVTYGQVPTYSAAAAAPAAYSYGDSLGAQTGYAASVGVGAAYGNTQAVFLERSRRGVYGATLPTTTLLATAAPVYGAGIGITTARGTSVFVPTATVSPFAGGLRGGFHLPFGHGGRRETVKVKVRSR